MGSPAADDGHLFCPACGGGLQFGEGKYPRCPGCGYVRYRNPVAGVAVVLQDSHGRVLMGRRATGIYAGQWCIPCGYVEWGEDIREAGMREFREETGLSVRLGDVVAVHSNFHNPKLLTVGTWFRGELVDGRLHPADGEFDVLDWHDPARPPSLAFPTDALVLEQLTRELRGRD